MNTGSVISVIGASQGVFLALIFLAGAKRHPSRLMLGLYLLIFSLGLLEPFHDRAAVGIPEKVFFSVLANGNLLYGPLMYFFIRLLVVRKLRVAQLLLHGLPFLIFLFADLLVIMGFASFEGAAAEWMDVVLFEFLVIQLLLYSVYSYRMFRRIRVKLLETYSSLNLHDIRWMSLILVFITFTYVLSFLFSNLILVGVLHDRSVFLVIQLMITVITYAFGYRMYVSPSLFQLAVPDTEQVDLNVSGKYRRSGLKTDRAREYLRELVAFMEAEKPYRNKDMTIYDLAAAMGISKNHLTEILNRYAGKNFFEFINFYRVEESKRLMLDPNFSHLSISGIGSEAGFRSDTAFHSNFKKATGHTPGAWRMAGLVGNPPITLRRKGIGYSRSDGNNMARKTTKPFLPPLLTFNF